MDTDLTKTSILTHTPKNPHPSPPFLSLDKNIYMDFLIIVHTTLFKK